MFPGVFVAGAAQQDVRAHMRLVANIFAICTMGTIAYGMLSIFPGTAESALLWTGIVTTIFALIGLFFWQPSKLGSQTLGEWIIFLIGSWLLSVILFIVACWLNDVPLSEALHFPSVLWEKRGRWWNDPILSPFYNAMVFGPGVTLFAVGSFIRVALLRLGGIPTSRPSTRDAVRLGTPHWLESRTLFFFIVLPLLGIILVPGVWVILEILDGNWGKSLGYTALWVPWAVLVSIMLNKIAMVRLSMTFGAAAFFLTAFALLRMSLRL